MVNNRPMHRNSHGFSLIEIIAVLVVISIIAATVFTRSVSFPHVNYVGQVEKIQSHLHYAKSLAMKRSMTNELWGINCDGNYYWLFHIKDRTDPAYFGQEANPIILPGEGNEKVSFLEIGVSMDPFILFFDKYGRPLKDDPFNSLAANLTIKINTADAEAIPKEIVIVPETGYIRPQ